MAVNIYDNNHNPYALVARLTNIANGEPTPPKDCLHVKKLVQLGHIEYDGNEPCLTDLGNLVLLQIIGSDSPPND